MFHAGKLVVVRCKERFTSDTIEQIFRHRLSDRKPVFRRSAAPDFVHNDKRFFRRRTEDVRGFRHLHEKGRFSAREIVRCTDAAKNSVDDAELRPFCRHKGARLREQCDERVLPEKCRLTGHVRSRDKRKRRRIVVSDRQIVRYEFSRPHVRFNDGMPALLHFERASVGDFRLRPSVQNGGVRKR